MYTNNALSNINTDRISILYITPPREKIDRYQATGAQFEEWMANTNTAGPACPVIQSTLTLDTLIQGNPPQKPEFNVWRTNFVDPPVEIRGSLQSTGLPDNNAYRFSELQGSGKSTDVPAYKHCIVTGAIIVQDVRRRKKGPQWTDIALALYKYDHEIDTLRYVFYTNVDNKETQPLVGKVLYRNHNLPGPEHRDGANPHAWNIHTPEFQQILGSKLGRATSRLVLAAWPRGTHRITTINTWFWSTSIQIRFDIQPIDQVGPTPPPAHSPTTPTPSSRRRHS